MIRRVRSFLKAAGILEQDSSFYKGNLDFDSPNTNIPLWLTSALTLFIKKIKV